MSKVFNELISPKEIFNRLIDDMKNWVNEKVIINQFQSYHNPQYQLKQLNKAHKTEDGSSLMHIAACHGYLKVIQEITEDRSNVNLKNNSNQTPLHVACLLGRLDIVKKLIDCDADIDAQDSRGNTPLKYACFNNETDTIKFIIGYGANVNLSSNTNWSPLHHACENGNEDVVEILLLNGANRKAVTKQGYSPLSIAQDYKKSQKILDMIEGKIVIDTKSTVLRLSQNGIFNISDKHETNNWNPKEITPNI